MMEPIPCLAAFYQASAVDPRIRSGHMGLYLALLLQWAAQGYQQPFSISRSQMMKLAKIQGQATYHKYIKELAEFGYIEYVPSYNPIAKSLIYFKYR